MTAPGRRVFPLVPRRRFVGAPFGDVRSPRRGEGDEPAGSRPYHPGDHIATIDWKASARLSAARATDEFVVREFFAEEAAIVAIVCDRRPAMGLYGPSLPWLDKGAALSAAADLIAASAHAARAELGYLEVNARGTHWLPPARGRLLDVRRRLSAAAFDAPPAGLERALGTIAGRVGRLLPGSFVFVLSDFIAPPSPALWQRARALRWDVVPVVIQDPVWEQSFPDVGGLLVPFVDPESGRLAPTWLSPRAARERATANERRLETLLRRFRRLGFDPVVVSSDAPDEIALRFQRWAHRRKLLLRRGA